MMGAQTQMEIRRVTAITSLSYFPQNTNNPYPTLLLIPTT
jgi:hypothetical protein